MDCDAVLEVDDLVCIDLPGPRKSGQAQAWVYASQS